MIHMKDGVTKVGSCSVSRKLSFLRRLSYVLDVECHCAVTAKRIGSHLYL
jgi:hypothetical protein